MGRAALGSPVARVVWLDERLLYNPEVGVTDVIVPGVPVVLAVPGRVPPGPPVDKADWLSKEGSTFALVVEDTGGNEKGYGLFCRARTPSWTAMEG